MANLIDSKMSQEMQSYAVEILKELSIDGLKVKFNSQANVLVFEQDRRVVSVPVVLIEQKKWSDIRFLFRAILDSQNSLWNRAADTNDWSGKNYYD